MNEQSLLIAMLQRTNTLNAMLQRTCALNRNNALNVHKQCENKGLFHLQHKTHDQLCRNYVQSMNGEEQMDAENIHTHKTFVYNFYFILTSSLPVLFSNLYAITNSRSAVQCILLA